MWLKHGKLIKATTGGLLVQLSLLPAAVVAAECSASSGAETVSLLELYTSEGCSSCPPADKWLSELKPDARQVVPLAFHVDYWDYIGWKDRFAKAEYSERQRKLAALGGGRFVYTPQFVLNGRDFRGVDATRLNDAVAAKQKLPPRADLSLNVVTQANGELTLQAAGKAVNAADVKHADIFVAIYENELVSQINAGENNGRALKHDYVVRHLFGAYRFNDSSAFAKDFTLNALWKGKPAGAVMFVQDAGSGEILQSLQLPFCS